MLKTREQSKIEVPSKWTIDLTQGLVAYVDVEDYFWLKKYMWHARKDHNTFYVVRRENYGFITMHRMIAERLGILSEMQPEVDHIDRDGLNNTRSNLRAASRSQNRINSIMPKRTNTASKYIGVVYNPGRKKMWKVTIQGGYVGRFADEVEAARAYDEEARKRYGDFAKTNF